MYSETNTHTRYPNHFTSPSCSCDWQIRSRVHWPLGPLESPHSPTMHAHAAYILQCLKTLLERDWFILDVSIYGHNYYKYKHQLGDINSLIIIKLLLCAGLHLMLIQQVTPIPYFSRGFEFLIKTIRIRWAILLAVFLSLIPNNNPIWDGKKTR